MSEHAVGERGRSGRNDVEAATVADLIALVGAGEIDGELAGRHWRWRSLPRVRRGSSGLFDHGLGQRLVAASAM
jgi:hypothetical protein